MPATTHELAHRVNDGVEVSLLWTEDEEELTVLVEDSKNEISLVLAAAKERALDVFYHPFAYADAA